MSEYIIKDYTRQRAKKLKVIITASKQKNKKIDVYDQNGKYICSIGDNRYLDYPSYIIEYGKTYADNRRRLYKMRHEKDRHIIGSTGYYADQLLW